MFEISSYQIHGAAAINLAAAFIVALIGAGVMLYERFSVASLRLVLLTCVLALALVCSALVDASGGPAVARDWFRLALAMDALLLPAVYALAVQLVSARRARMLLAAWLTGILLAAWSLAAPTLMLGVVALVNHSFVADGGWAGSLFVLFMSILLIATVLELVWSYRSAAHPEDRNRALTLAAGFLIGALAMIDFFVWPQPFVSGITPWAVTGAILVFGYAAIRFRAFSPLPSFAAERILQVMGDGVLLCDAEGRIRNANRAACAFLGRAEQELAGMHVSCLLHDTTPAAPDAESGEADGFMPFLHREVRDRELVLLRHDGHGIDVSLSSEPLRRRGAVVGSVIVFRDISERLGAARVLRATEQRYHSLFWNNPALAYEIDRNGAILEANPAVERVLGMSAAALRGRSFGEFIHADDAARANATFGRVLGGDAEEYRFRLTLPDSSVLEIKGVSIPVIRDGAVVGVFGVALDITAEERVRRELELQRLEFAELFEASPEAILIADENNVVVRVNPEFTRTFGYPPHEAVGRFVDDLLVTPELAAEGAQLTREARGGGVVRMDTVRRRSDGSLVDVSVLARELRLPGRPPQLYGIYRDVTDHKRAERSLRERDEELRHAQRLEAVGKLAGGVAHDFNNLVTVINGHVGFALEALPANHAARQDLEQIERAGSRAAVLTQQLLAFSRRQMLRPETVDLSVVIADVRRMLGRIIGEHIRFETSHEGDVHVRADRGQLDQLLVNLVVNARDAMPEGGQLSITTDRARLPDGDTAIDGWEIQPGEYVRISVTDTGSGMDEATRARAFEPFFTTKERGKGTGLGLATVFGIAKQSGGHVTAASTPGRGTTIRVWLPAAAAGAAAADAVTPPPRPTTCIMPATGTRILVVEDEAALRDLAARVLRRAGHEVLLASDGIEALSIAEDTRLDAVVSDLIMPRMGGRELARRLRRDHPALPIVLMSGYDDEITTNGARENILSKPFTPADLARRVEEALSGARVAGAVP